MQTTEAEQAALPPHIRFVIGVDEAGRGCMAGPVGVAATLYRLSSTPVSYTVSDSKVMKEDLRADTLQAMCAELSSGGSTSFLHEATAHGACCLVRPQPQQPLQALAVALVDVAVINARNILNATLDGMAAVCDAVVYGYNMAMRDAEPLTPANCAVLIDGNRVPWTFLPDAERERVRLLAAKKAEARKRIGAELEGLRGFVCTTVVKGDATLLSIAAASVVAKVSRDTFAATVMHRDYPVYGFDQHKGYCTAGHQAALAMHGPSPLHRLEYAPVKAVLAGRQSSEPPKARRKTPRTELV